MVFIRLVGFWFGILLILDVLWRFLFSVCVLFCGCSGFWCFWWFSGFQTFLFICGLIICCFPGLVVVMLWILPTGLLFVDDIIL